MAQGQAPSQQSTDPRGMMGADGSRHDRHSSLHSRVGAGEGMFPAHPRSPYTLPLPVPNHTHPGIVALEARGGLSAAEPGGQQGNPPRPELPQIEGRLHLTPSLSCPTPGHSPPEHSPRSLQTRPLPSTCTSSNSGHGHWEASSPPQSSLRLLWLLRRQTGVCFWRAPCQPSSTGEGAPKGQHLCLTPAFPPEPADPRPGRTPHRPERTPEAGKQRGGHFRKGQRAPKTDRGAPERTAGRPGGFHSYAAPAVSIARDQSGEETSKMALGDNTRNGGHAGLG